MVGQTNKKAATAKLERLISCALAVFINRPQFEIKSAIIVIYKIFLLRSIINIKMNKGNQIDNITGILSFSPIILTPYLFFYVMISVSS